MKNALNDNIVKFHNIEEFYFPRNCMICGDKTENYIEKTEYGSFTGTRDYKKDYKFKLPVCSSCNANINLKAGKSRILLLMGFLFGISFGILLYYLTYTILLSITVFIILVIFPYLSYRAKIRPRIKLNDFMQMKVIPNEDLVQFNFKNKHYANYVNKINQENIKEKEKEKSERIEKEILNPPERKEELTSTTEPNLDGESFPNSTIFPNKEVIEPKSVDNINPVAKKCPKCGNNIEPGWKFCVSCSEVIKDY
ncbi:MAG: hypothetical protein FK730_17050 [Asgard group archaeon]|nr:hypothetical protein [Asgard group archaeon]